KPATTNFRSQPWTSKRRGGVGPVTVCRMVRSKGATRPDNRIAPTSSKSRPLVERRRNERRDTMRWIAHKPKPPSGKGGETLSRRGADRPAKRPPPQDGTLADQRQVTSAAQTQAVVAPDPPPSVPPISVAPPPTMVSSVCCPSVPDKFSGSPERSFPLR